MWKVLKHYSIPGKIITLVQGTYEGMPCRVVHRGQLSDCFNVRTGVRQGCLLSPFMLLLVIDWIMRTTTKRKKNGSQWTPWTQLEDKEGGTDVNVGARIGKARAAFNMLRNIWKSQEIRTETKLCIFNSNVKSFLLYGSETCRCTKKAPQKIQTFINSCLRCILNIWWPVKIGYEELWQRGNQEPVGRQILRRKWGWIGPTVQKEASNITRQSLTWNPQGKRRGRPQNS